MLSNTLNFELAEAKCTIKRLKDREQDLLQKIRFLEVYEAKTNQKVSFLECKIEDVMRYNKTLLDKVLNELNNNYEQMHNDPYPTFMKIFEMEEQLEPTFNITVSNITGRALVTINYPLCL